MKEKRILNVLSLVDEKYIEEAAPTKTSKIPVWLKWGPLAACLCFIIGSAIVFNYRNSFSSPPIDDGTVSSGAAVSDAGVTIPPLNVTLSESDNAAADMIGFFIYQGRCYVQYEWIYEEVSFVGEYLGTATGLIDEWTPKEGYVELAGSVSGDFYSVKGFDPGFMLCMVHENGAVSTYVNNNGITLKTGADLFDARLALAGNYTSVQYQSRSDWYYGNGEPITLETGYEETIENFVAALNAAPFMLTKDIPLEAGENLYDDKEIWHMFFRMNNGMTVHLRLFEGGYVRFQGLMDVCVKPDAAIFDGMTEIFSSDGESNHLQ